MGNLSFTINTSLVYIYIPFLGDKLMKMNLNENVKNIRRIPSKLRQYIL